MTLLFANWFMDLMSALMQPFYHAVSGILVFFHAVFAPLFGSGSGLTWTLAIIMLTVLIRTLLIPLFVKQIRSSRNMQLVQPKVQELQKKYGHDRERLGQETMKLYKEEGVNPAASCLPLLLQMPIFLALFRVLDGAARGIPRGMFLKNHPELVDSLRNAELLGVKISGRFWPMTDGFGATQVFALILIIAMTGVLFITQLQLMSKNMPPEALTGPMAQQQKMMLYTMPVIFGLGGVSIPIGVLIYWLVSNAWTMVQQWFLIRNSPAPNTPAYVEWEERMRAKGKDPHAIEAKRLGKKLHVPAEDIVVDDTGAARVKPHTVQRQNVTRDTTRQTGSTASSRVVRQQPRKQTRATRKQTTRFPNAADQAREADEASD